MPRTNNHLPDETEQRRLILAALQETSWGRYNLVRLLRGETEVDDRGRASVAFGCLGFRSRSALEKMIEKMVSSGELEEVALSHGGVALALSPAGKRQLRQGG